jgi:hypothetical protein
VHTMKAIVQDAYGSTDALELREIDSARSVVEVVAEELGPSRRWATATTTRATQSPSQ